MPITRIPPFNSPQSKTQIPLSIAASSGDGAAALGRQIQQTEATLVDSAIKGLDRIAANLVADRAAVANNAVNVAGNKMKEAVAQRFAQSVDENGNPTYGTLMSDVDNITNQIIEDHLNTISDPRARQEAESRLRNQQSSLKIKGISVYQNQKTDYVRATTFDSVSTLSDKVLDGEITTEQAAQEIDSLLNQAGGAFSFQERRSIKESGLSQIEINRAQNILSTAQDPDALNDYLNSLDDNEYLSFDQKDKIRKQGSKVLKALEDNRVKENSYKEINKRILNEETLADLDPSLVDEHYKHVVSLKEKELGRPLNLAEKAAIALNYKGQPPKGAAAVISSGLRDPNLRADAYTAYKIYREHNSPILENIDDKARNIADAALLKQMENPALTDEQALDIASNMYRDMSDDEIKALNKAFAKEISKVDIDNEINNSIQSWFGLGKAEGLVNNISEILGINDPVSPEVRKAFKDMLRLKYTELGDMDAAIEAAASSLGPRLMFSQVSGGQIIFDAPELIPGIEKETVDHALEEMREDIAEELLNDHVLMKDTLVTGDTKEEVQEAFIQEGVDKNLIDLESIYFTTNRVTRQMSDEDTLYYIAQRKVGGQLVPLYVEGADGVRRLKVVGINKSDLIKYQNTKTLQKLEAEKIAAMAEEDRAAERLGALQTLMSEPSLEHAQEAIQKIILDPASDTLESLINMVEGPGSIVAEDDDTQSVFEKLTMTDILVSPVARNIVSSALTTLKDKVDGVFSGIGPGGENTKEIPEGQTPVSSEASEIMTKVAEAVSPSAMALSGLLKTLKPKTTNKPKITLNSGKDVSKYAVTTADLPNDNLGRAQALLHSARLASPDNDVLAQLALLQALHESNFGRSGLATNDNNLFGIKGSHNGQFSKYKTTEFIDGVPQEVRAKFRKYGSITESMSDYVSLIHRLDRYKAVREAETLDEAIDAIGRSGYATDPEYANKLRNLKDQYLNKVLEMDKPTSKPLSIPQGAVQNIQKAGLSQHAAVSAYTAVQQGIKSGNIPKTDRVVIVDFTKPYGSNRLVVQDTRTGEVIFQGNATMGVADKFSNRPGSNLSSKGLMVTGGAHQGSRVKDGIKLHGLEKGKNDNVYKRGIVIHGTNSTRSHGCIAMPHHQYEILKRLIKGGYAVYVHG